MNETEVARGCGDAQFVCRELQRQYSRRTISEHSGVAVDLAQFVCSSRGHVIKHFSGRIVNSLDAPNRWDVRLNKRLL